MNSATGPAKAFRKLIIKRISDPETLRFTVGGPHARHERFGAVSGDVRIGWQSPVSEVVNPAFIELNGRGGLGWLEGFNEMVTRCGYEWVGHPGMDKGVMLPLHGLAANIPASKVVLSIDEEPPYTIRLKGDLKEQAFKLVNFVIIALK